MWFTKTRKLIITLIDGFLMLFYPIALIGTLYQERYFLALMCALFTVLFPVWFIQDIKELKEIWR